MPRLIGKQSDHSGYVGLLLILAIATAGSLEYLGAINVIPGFGRDAWTDRQFDPFNLR
jgi:hypothetical protein